MIAMLNSHFSSFFRSTEHNTDAGIESIYQIRLANLCLKRFSRLMTARCLFSIAPYVLCVMYAAAMFQIRILFIWPLQIFFHKFVLNSLAFVRFDCT